VVTQSYIRSQAGLTQCKSYVVAAAKMFVNQRLQIDISQNVAAVGQKWIRAELAFCILDAAAGL